MGRQRSPAPQLPSPDAVPNGACSLAHPPYPVGDGALRLHSSLAVTPSISVPHHSCWDIRKSLFGLNCTVCHSALLLGSACFSQPPTVYPLLQH